jgi:hypothetical protein
MNKSETKNGYGVFGKAYKYMFKNDLHHKGSVDHAILKNMIFLDEDSKSFLYKAPKSVSKNISNHELYEIALKLMGDDHLESIDRTIEFVYEIVERFNTPFEEMIFGGTELEIIKRGSDCAQIFLE